MNAHAKPLASPLEGRWDITVDVAGKASPSWLEVSHSGTRTLVGRFVSVSGSARPISEVHFKDGKFNFSIPPQWEKGEGDFSVEGTLDGDKISGTLTTPEGKKHSWTGVRAPALRRATAPAWDKPVKLTEGNTIKGWHAAGTNQWTIKDGVLKSEKSGANLITDEKYDDFKLHVEFRIPKGSNSGVYLRGRYEVQVTDGKGLEPAVDQLGAVYGFLTPSEMVAKEPGEWQSFDVTLIGRMITLDVNGQRVITNQEIPGITGGALDSHEGEPGPLYIQGDHGAVEYRNIVITPAK
ncbi:large multifunctional protein- glycosyl hydrolase [Persicitalea jodogahamensis]|uniref:Large multifunctional protein-glycosyl hydrolase n=2 Tax=Persicitalea jodogahamensis TaxID=402147 RepID=A0A8J3D389_9BACT|nr:large multifunctional protein- glycosyl hydrolase [Persicitalea jodogahamensis]